MSSTEGAIVGEGPLTGPSMLGSHGAPGRCRRCASSVMSPAGWADCAPVARLPWRRDGFSNTNQKPKRDAVSAPKTPGQEP